MTDDELEALRELRAVVFASSATESETDEADAAEHRHIVPREESDPPVLRSSDNAAAFARYLFGDDDTISDYQPDPPGPWAPRVLDTY